MRVAVTFTVGVPASSSMVVWSPVIMVSVSTLSVTLVDGPSLSVMVIVAEFTRYPVTAPCTKIVSSSSSTLSSIGVMVMVVVALVWPPVIVMSFSVLWV
ncbi:MAG: hypothetical protein OXN93_07615 [bacterium]|nr:hypothetical protein [bacterium]